MVFQLPVYPQQRPADDSGGGAGREGHVVLQCHGNQLKGVQIRSSVMIFSDCRETDYQALTVMSVRETSPTVCRQSVVSGTPSIYPDRNSTGYHWERVALGRKVLYMFWTQNSVPLSSTTGRKGNRVPLRIPRRTHRIS